MLFPIKRGKFETLTAFGIDYHTAIYRCKIEGESKLFRFNQRCYYPTQDVRRARELNLTITLAQDGKPNVLYYDRHSCMTGAQLFGKFVKLLFPLKEKNVPLAKSIMNSLWGALSQKKVTKMVFHEDDKYEAFPGKRVYERIPYGDDQLLITFISNDSFFKYDWARIKPFVLAKGRSIISKAMEPHLQHVVRTHTDSMWCTKQLDIKTGTKPGDLKYEGYCPDAKITNNTKIKGEFKKI
jgi:hypothetical protein